ncbi:MAG TPA: DUF6691 family protein [Burkholderiales bacterium]|nr:DUF6691 family protein [Burkholderiales bacterium]
MSKLASALGAGFLFGLGLWVSGMANPRKVLGFLDVAGNWDASLMLVMAGAVAVTLAGFRLFRGKFEHPLRQHIDARLVGGAAIFGIGWGMAGYCPGPALTALSTLSSESIVFVAAMVAGGLLHRLTQRG